MSDFAGLPVVKPEEVGLASDRIERITRTMERAVEAAEVPGVVTVIARHGKVVHDEAHGYLDMERENELGLDSIFRMYSQTKPITAVAVMQLHEDGAFFLDEPLARYMPEFADRQVIAHAPEEPVRGTPVNLVHTVSAKRELTIRDLLTMTSGLPDVGRTPTAFAHLLLPAWEGTGFLDSDTRINDPLGTVEDMVSILATLPLSSQPGEVWHYASDFDVISVLIERVSGMPLDEYFRERIFEPLGMHDSSFYCPADKLGRLVTDHQWDEKGNVIVRDPPETSEKAGRGERKLLSGNGLFGGALCTAADYTRFAQMLLNEGHLDGVRLLGRKSVELMTANHIGDRNVHVAGLGGPGYGFGFGYMVRKSVAGTAVPGSVGTFGWGGAAGTWFFVDPKEDLIGLFFTHIFGYQFLPTADLFHRFEKMTYEALV